MSAKTDYALVIPRTPPQRPLTEPWSVRRSVLFILGLSTALWAIMLTAGFFLF